MIEVLVIIVEYSRETLDINPVLTHGLILIQNYIITPPTTFIDTMIVTDLAMTNNLKNPLQDHFILLAPYIIQHSLVAHISLTLVLGNVLLVTTTHHLDAINHHIVLLLNHVMTATAVALTLIQNHFQIIKTNPLLTSLNNPRHLFTIFPPLSLKLLCILLTPPLVQNFPLIQIIMLMLELLLPGLLT